MHLYDPVGKRIAGLLDSKALRKIRCHFSADDILKAAC